MIQMGHYANIAYSRTTEWRGHARREEVIHFRAGKAMILRRWGYTERSSVYRASVGQDRSAVLANHLGCAQVHCVNIAIRYQRKGPEELPQTSQAVSGIVPWGITATNASRSQPPVKRVVRLENLARPIRVS